MSINERKEKEKTILREKILKAAEGLFVEEGYENLSMRKIAARIEYSPTTIYRFFKNKEDMMKAITADGYSELTDKFVSVKNKIKGDPIKALQSMIREYIKLYLEKPKLFELWLRHGDIVMEDRWLYAYIGKEKYKIFYSWFEYIEACIQQENFQSKNVHEIFFSIWSAIHGLISLRIHFPNIPWPTEEEHINNLISMIFDGLKSNKRLKN